jgi:hypothetical protein
VLLTVEDHQDELLHHSGLTLDEFWTKLKTSTLDPQDIHEIGNIEATTKTTITPAIPPFKSIIEGDASTAPGMHDTSLYAKTKPGPSKLKKIADTHLSTAATATATMDLEDAATATAGLKELIHVETKKGLSAMQHNMVYFNQIADDQSEYDFIEVL